MKVEVSHHGDVTIVAMYPKAGRMIDGQDCEGLASRLRTLLEKGRKKILLDLGRVDLVNSGLISRLEDVHAHALTCGAVLYLCNVDQKIENILAFTLAVRVLNVLGTRAEALEFLGGVDVQLKPEGFEIHSPEVHDFTARLCYLWPSGESPVTVNQGILPSSGRAQVHIIDAGGTEIFSQNAADPVECSRLTGKRGKWKIEFDLCEYSGKLDFELHILDLEVVNQGDVAVVVIHRSILMGTESDRMESLLRGSLQEGKKKILVDLDQVRIFGARPLGSLCKFQVHALKHGAALYLCNVDKRIANILACTRAVRVLNVLGTRAEAVEVLGALDVQLKPKSFELHFSEVHDFTTRLSYLWPNGESVVTVNQGGLSSSGRAMVRLFDAGFTEIFTQNVGDSAEFNGLTGKPGDWRVEIDLCEYSGKLDFEMHNA